MEISDLEYHFKIHNIKDMAVVVALALTEEVYNEDEKRSLYQFLNMPNDVITKEHYLGEIEKYVAQKHELMCDKVENLAKELQQKWNNIKDLFMTSICEVLGIEIDLEKTLNTFCYLSIIPINNITLDGYEIMLDATKSVDEVFNNFIIMLAKIIVFEKWYDKNSIGFKHEIVPKARTWIFIDIALDAIFANSKMHLLCDRPTTNYFYNLKINNTNFINEFRRLFPLVDIDDFFIAVYMFVDENYSTLIKFVDDIMIK